MLNPQSVREPPAKTKPSTARRLARPATASRARESTRTSAERGRYERHRRWDERGMKLNYSIDNVTSVHFHVKNNVLFHIGFVLAHRRIAVCVLVFVTHHMFASSVGFPHSHQRLKINSVRVVFSSGCCFEGCCDGGVLGCRWRRWSKMRRR